MGGWDGKDEDTAPLCFRCHTERHSMPLADFERKRGVDLRAVAALYAAELERTDG
jgi:hypothetical protein